MDTTLPEDIFGTENWPDFFRPLQTAIRDAADELIKVGIREEIAQEFLNSMAEYLIKSSSILQKITSLGTDYLPNHAESAEHVLMSLHANYLLLNKWLQSQNPNEIKKCLCLIPNMSNLDTETIILPTSDEKSLREMFTQAHDVRDRRFSHQVSHAFLQPGGAVAGFFGCMFSSKSGGMQQSLHDYLAELKKNGKDYKMYCYVAEGVNRSYIGGRAKDLPKIQAQEIGFTQLAQNLELLDSTIAGKVNRGITPIVAIDEITFFVSKPQEEEELLWLLKSLKAKGAKIMVGGLDFNYRAEMWSLISRLINEGIINENLLFNCESYYNISVNGTRDVETVHRTARFIKIGAIGAHYVHDWLYPRKFGDDKASVLYQPGLVCPYEELEEINPDFAASMREIENLQLAECYQRRD